MQSYGGYARWIAGNKIKEIRKEKGISQVALAEKAGVSPVTLRNYENGKTLPSQNTINKIIEALELPENYIYNPDTVKTIGTILYGTSEEKLLLYFRQLNETGQGKVVDTARDLTKISDYRKD